MKNWMKGLFLAVTAAALTGCGGSVAESPEKTTEGSAEEYIQAAQQMLEEADSFTAEFHADVKMDGAGGTVTEGIVTMVKEPLFVNVNTTMRFADMVQEYDLYLEETEDAVNQYMSYDGEWTEMTMEKESALTMVQIYNTLYNMETILSAAENWNAEQDGKEIILSGVIPEKKFYDVEEYTRWFQLTGMSGLAEVYFAGAGDVPVTVSLDAKSCMPHSYSIDLAHALETVTNNVLKELSGNESENGITVDQYVIVSELTELNDVEAGEIPVEAKSSAINYEKEISLLESE